MGILASVFSVIASLVLPVAAFIWLALKRKGYLKPLLLGVLCFGVFQVLTRIPVLSLMGQTAWYTMFAMTRPAQYALFLGVTAGLFEEGGRWIVMKLLMRDRRRVNDGIAFGIGHGGLEAVLLVGVNAAVILALQGGSTAPGLTFAGGVERLLTMIIHVAFSVMVLKSVVLKKPLWLVVAFVLHAAIDFLAVYYPHLGMGVLASEVILGVFALALLGYIIIEIKRYKGGEIQ